MTEALLSGLVTGSAPPANAPPVAPGSASRSSSEPGTNPDIAFADLLSAASADGEAGGTASVTVISPPLTTTASETGNGDALLAQLMAIARGIDPEASADETAVDTEHDLPVLDRPAEAGETDEAPIGANALEAMLAYLVLNQRVPMDPAAMPSLPEDVRALVQALTAPAADGTSMDPPAQETSASIVDVASEIVSGILKAPPSVSSAPAVEDSPAAADAAAPGSMPVDAPPVAVVTASAPAAPLAEPAGKTATQTSEQATAPSVEVAPGAPSAVATGPERHDERDPDAGDVGPDLDVDIRVVRRDDAAIRDMQPAISTQPAAAVDSPPRVERVVDVAAVPSSIADTVQSAAISGDSEVRLLLNPPDLGHIDVTVRSIDGAIHVRVEASHAATREAMEQAMLALHQALEARDLRVERLEVRSTDTGRGSLDTSGSGQRSGSGNSGEGREGHPDWSPVAMLDGVAMPVNTTRSQATDGRIDVMA